MSKTHNAQEAGSHLSFGILLGMIIGAALGVLLGDFVIGLGAGITLGAALGGFLLLPMARSSSGNKSLTRKTTLRKNQ